MVGARARAAGCGGVLGAPSLAVHLSKMALQQLAQNKPAILQQAQQVKYLLIMCFTPNFRHSFMRTF